MKIRFCFIVFAISVYLPVFLPKLAFAYPEYSAFSGSNCMSCHTGPVGGFGRKPQNTNSAGYITDKFYISGDLQFMALADQRDGQDDRFVLFPMEGALSAGFKISPIVTLSASQDFGMLREAYGMVHNENETMYVRAGYFSLPYGLLVADHTSFIKEGRVESGPTTFEERGLGAGLFSVRYKDSGIEAGLSGRPFFLNLAFTSGVVGQEERALPSNQAGNKRALTRRIGFMTDHVCLGGSLYTNDNELLDRRILRYGGFGWLRFGPWALIFEHDEGEDERFTVAGSTQSRASYVENVFGFPFPGQNWPSYLKIRWEFLDNNRSLDEDELQRWVFAYRFAPWDYMSFETTYRINKEKPVEQNNDDLFVIAHLYF